MSTAPNAGGSGGLIENLENATATISNIVAALVDDGFGDPIPSIDASATYESRQIDLGAGGQIRQWLIVDTVSENNWVLVETEGGSLSLYRAESIAIQILPGIATINDSERVVSGGATVLEVAQLQQRLRYFDYPGASGNLLVS